MSRLFTFARFTPPQRPRPRPAPVWVPPGALARCPNGEVACEVDGAEPSEWVGETARDEKRDEATELAPSSEPASEPTELVQELRRVRRRDAANSLAKAARRLLLVFDCDLTAPHSSLPVRGEASGALASSILPPLCLG